MPIPKQASAWKPNVKPLRANKMPISKTANVLKIPHRNAEPQKSIVPQTQAGNLGNVKMEIASPHHVNRVIAQIPCRDSAPTNRAFRHAVSTAAFANRAVKHKSVLLANVSPNNATEMSATRVRAVKMTIPIVGRAARTAIHLQAMQQQEYALPMALAKSRLAKQIITSITMHVKQTASRTAVHMAHNAMYLMQIMNVKTRYVLLNATTDLNNRITNACQTSLFQHGMWKQMVLYRSQYKDA